MKDGTKRVIDKPSVIFIPGPVEHRILAEQSAGAEMVCATISMESAHQKLLLEAFPPLTDLRYGRAPGMGPPLFGVPMSGPSKASPEPQRQLRQPVVITESVSVETSATGTKLVNQVS